MAQVNQAEDGSLQALCCPCSPAAPGKAAQEQDSRVKATKCCGRPDKTSMAQLSQIGKDFSVCGQRKGK